MQEVIVRGEPYCMLSLTPEGMMAVFCITIILLTNISANTHIASECYGNYFKIDFNYCILHKTFLQKF